MGIIGKVPGIKDTRRGQRAVMNYVLIPGDIEAIMRSLREFAKLRFELGRSVEEVRKKMSESIVDAFQRVRVIGGTDDGREFLIQGDIVNISFNPSHRFLSSILLNDPSVPYATSREE